MSDSKERLLEIIVSRMLMKNDHELSMPEELGVLVWTGFKMRADSMYPCAQIMWRTPRVKGIAPRYHYYVDIPSMNHGRVERGQPLDIRSIPEVSHFMDERTTREEIAAWVKEGLSLLLDDILKDNPELFPLHTSP